MTERPAASGPDLEHFRGYLRVLAEIELGRRWRTKVDPSDIVQLLRERYACRRILLEGGPTFNRSAIEAGVVDELFLTLAPKLVAGPGKSIVEGDPLARALDLLSLYEHEAELFLRYAVRP